MKIAQTKARKITCNLSIVSSAPTDHLILWEWNIDDYKIMMKQLNLLLLKFRIFIWKHIVVFRNGTAFLPIRCLLYIKHILQWRSKMLQRRGSSFINGSESVCVCVCVVCRKKIKYVPPPLPPLSSVGGKCPTTPWFQYSVLKKCSEVRSGLHTHTHTHFPIHL
jgi:hypothetical protein